MLGARCPGGHGLRPLGLGVLDVVRLVDHEHRGRGQVEREEPDLLERRHGHAALARPLCGLLGTLGAVDVERAQRAVPPDLAHPARHDARGAHHEEVRRAARGEVRHRGDGLHGLAEAHLVAEDRASLGEGVARPEHLVAAQRDGQEGLVERLLAHTGQELGRKVALGGLEVAPEVHDVVEQRVVRRRACPEVRPRLEGVDGCGVEGPDASCGRDGPGLLGVLGEPRKVAHGVRCPTAPGGQREEGPDRSGRLLGRDPVLRVPLEEGDDHLPVPRRSRARGVEPRKGLDEAGRERVAGGVVDPEP